MFSIHKQNTEISFEFYDICILNCKNPTRTYKNLFIDSNIIIDNKRYKSEDIIYINELTKMSDFINLNKKSFLYQEILNKLIDYPLINTENLVKLVDYLNDMIHFDAIETCDGDTAKLVNLLMELCNDSYLNNNWLKVIFEKCFADTSKIFVFDNVSWLDFDFLLEYLNDNKFVILTNDVRNYLKYIEQLEAVCNYHEDKGEINEILDYEKLIAFVEMETSEPFDEKHFKIFIDDKDSLYSLRILNIINKI